MPPAHRLVDRITLFQMSLPLCALIAVVGVAWPDEFSSAISNVTSEAFNALDWFFMTAVTGFLILCAYLAFSSWGKVKLGKDEDKPEFSTTSWLAMLFAAGMGVGLLFWGVAEPMLHYQSPPTGGVATPESARQGMVRTLFHWGLHAWGVYCVGGLILAYFRYRRGAPYLPGAPLRSAFTGRWVEPVSRLADLVAVLAVAFGVAGSLAMGILQFHTGLHVTTGIDRDSSWIAIGLLFLFFCSYMTSAATSLDKGIKWLSNINMVLAVLLMLFVLLVGPTAFLMRNLVNTTGDYLTSLPAMTLRVYPYQNLADWMGSWTLVYFLWWIGWTPFVGIFIARISKGRTIREFVLGVLIAPTGFSLIWFAVFGGIGIYEDQHVGGISQLVRDDVTSALFSLFDRLPLSMMLSTISIILIYIFIVTSVDSATFVLGMLTTRGSFNPPVLRKLSWGIILAALGGALLLTGNISVVKAGAISFALPLTLILILQTSALVRAIRVDSQTSPVAPTQPSDGVTSSDNVTDDTSEPEPTS